MLFTDQKKTFAFLGDSITADTRHNYISMLINKLSGSMDIENIAIINSGVDSSSIFDAIDRVPELFNENDRIDFLFILIGVNDSKRFYVLDKPLVDPSVFKEKYRDLIRLVRSKNPDLKIILMTLPCLLFEKIKTSDHLANYWYWDIKEYEIFNNIIREICSEFNLILADIYDAFSNQKENLSAFFIFDGVHPNSKGHQLISMKLFDVLIK